MFAITFALAALASLVSASYENNTVTTITHDVVVTEFTTYCPYPTTLVTNNQTYTVTGATTLTVNNCPCTLKSTETVTGTTKTSPAPGISSTKTGAPVSSHPSATHSVQIANGAAQIAGAGVVAVVVAALV